MGLAELVPGVSGGTMAFISGIYYRLIAALASFGVGSIALLRHPRVFWQHHQLSFLLALGVGMGIGIAAFARLIGYMMEHAQPVLWAFLRASSSYRYIKLARLDIPRICWPSAVLV